MTDRKDAWDAVEEAREPSRVFFGQVDMDVWFCVLQKGVGKVPFDPEQHKAERRRTAVEVTVAPLPASGLQFPLERGMIAESREWAGILLPSLKALGVSPREVNGQWAQVELAPTGRKYTNANGEEKVATTIKFLALYESEEECQEAADALFGGGNGANSGNPGNGQSDPERAVAEQFLPVLVKQAEDRAELTKILAANPIVGKYFTVDSPEVVNLWKGVKDDVPF